MCVSFWIQYRKGKKHRKVALAEKSVTKVICNFNLLSISQFSKLASLLTGSLTQELDAIRNRMRPRALL